MKTSYLIRWLNKYKSHDFKKQAEFFPATQSLVDFQQVAYIHHMLKSIQIRGARVHNLKNIDVDILRNRFVVITGVSGSGKSSLAFDTLYAEGQRRFVESMSAYARQFLQRMDRPDVDEIRGISPTVAIEQKNPTKNSRSTVATATEIHDYLRLLFARVGRTTCPQCGDEIKKDQVADGVDRIFALPDDTRIQIAFPLSGRSMKDKMFELSDLKARGYHRVLIEGKPRQVDDLTQKQVQSKQELLVLVDRLKVREKSKTRLADSLELAFRDGFGKVVILTEQPARLSFYQAFDCARCGLPFVEPEPRLFSFNNPFGACRTCNGFGEIIELDLDRVIPDGNKSLNQGAVAPWNTPKRRDLFAKLQDAAIQHGIDMNVPWSELPEEHKRIVIEGDRPFPGIRGFFRKLERKKYKIGVRVLLSRYRGFVPCPDCKMTRLRQEALYVKINNRHIGEVSRMSIAQAHRFFKSIKLSESELEIARQILKELRSRLTYLVDVGLEYLTLDRRTQTLSGGEYQRINLATAVGFKLMGSLYVLDEPSIGLHPRDNARLIKILLALRDLGNTVVVVEHDREMMRVSDQLLDLGPFAGKAGGELVYQGTYESILQNGARTLTAKYLKGEQCIAIPKARRTACHGKIRVVNACENNLRHLTIDFPLGQLVVVTGVSGSGKSTLVHDVLFCGISKQHGVRTRRVGKHDGIEGLPLIEGCILVDQSPIGRTPRSNPVTYTKAFEPIRHVFANSIRAKSRGFTPGTFSFNTVGGRCERCEGAGVEKVEMQFLADLLLTCEVCEGRRYKREVLSVHYKGKNISEVLALTVSEALQFFSDVPRICDKLKVLEEVGLGYLCLGQPATTLSGGEAQRVKLAAYLGEKARKHHLYIFDEPTTGLHFHDISKLLLCFDHLITAGHSVIVIEHNLDVIKCADHVIDLGPEGGGGGGQLVVEGPPEEIARHPESYTGRYLKAVL